MKDHKYRLLYDIQKKPEGILKEDIPKDWGACDAIMIASILYPEDGSLSIMIIGEDGRTNQKLSDEELFKVWAVLSAKLSESKTLGESQKDLCHITHSIIKNALELIMRHEKEINTSENKNIKKTKYPT